MLWLVGRRKITNKSFACTDLGVYIPIYCNLQLRQPAPQPSRRSCQHPGLTRWLIPVAPVGVKPASSSSSRGPTAAGAIRGTVCVAQTRHHRHQWARSRKGGRENKLYTAVELLSGLGVLVRREIARIVARNTWKLIRNFFLASRGPGMMPAPR